MLSYRHAFHAGNVADVHKHVAWLVGIRALLKKPAPFCLVDACAGAGLYDLGADTARRTGEWERGIGPILAATDMPDAVRRYADLARRLGVADAPPCYPGSPALAAAMLRSDDRLLCLELHPADHSLLKRHFAGDRRVHVHRRDVREGLPALVPPAERRGLVLIDPPYERAAEYDEVPVMLDKALARWPNGGYLLWYPLLAGNAHVSMLKALARRTEKLLVQELLLFPDAPGLRGSGLAWINPPWQADAALEQAGGWLAATLGDRAARASTGWQHDSR